MSLVSTISVAGLFTASGCTVLLDKTATQCTVDADCAHFNGHPLCDQGVCVASGLGPEGCFADTPKMQRDFLNACSTSKCVPFNNCDRLGMCGSSAALPATLDPTPMSSPPLVNPVAAPMNLCTDGAPGTPSAPNMVWLYGSADFGPLLRAAQPSLSNPADGGTPYRAVFQGNTSCGGVSSVFLAANRIMHDPPTETQGGWAFYFDEAGKQVNCRLDPFGATSPQGKVIDIGISNLYSPTCDPALMPGSTVAEYTGPVTPFVLSVPATSSETSISVEAAHFVFGLGGKAPSPTWMDAMPWTDPTNYSIRNANSGSTVLTALLIDVPKTKFWGVDRRSTENLRDSLLASTSSNSSIGILSIDFNDKYRGNLKALYLQSKGQLCGYLPDSGPTTYDKSNVRDGHYPLWGYVHFFTPLQAGGVPSPAANAMILLFRVQKVEQRLLDEIIKASLTPQCAMKVERGSEMGDFAPRKGLSCGCYYDFKTKGKTDCQVCVTAEDCPGQAECNYGYCEATGS